jgi:hypothetical protein
VSPAVAPDTFGYTLTESWLAGVPVVVGPGGATAERVTEQGGGLVAQMETPECYLQVLKSLLRDASLLGRLRSETGRISAAGTFEWYREMYRDLVGGKRTSNLAVQTLDAEFEAGGAVDNTGQRSAPSRVLRYAWRMRSALAPAGSRRERIYLQVRRGLVHR